MNGQLLPKEREFLYESVIEAKPKLVLEVGTWKGGGSTWQIVKALEVNDSGVLITCETDKQFYEEAMNLYKENRFIEIYYRKSSKLIDWLISRNDIPDFCFFDGPEDETTAMEDFIKLDPYLKSGCVFMMHDFDLPSIKAKIMRPFLERLPGWKILFILTAPESVGLVKAVKL